MGVGIDVLTEIQKLLCHDFGGIEVVKKPYTGNLHANPILARSDLPALNEDALEMTVMTKKSC
jgi:hypothetical protein